MTEMRNMPVQADTDEIDLVQLLVPLVHHWKFVIGVPLVGAMMFALLFYFIAPRKYMSAADLVVMPPKFKTEFQETSPSVQYYKTLIESPALLASVEQELIKKNILKQTDRLEIGKQIEDSVFTKKRAGDVTLSPIIRLAAYGKTPDDAFTILDTWIRHINDTVQRLNEKGKNEAISFIDREFPKQRVQYQQALKKLEDDKARFLNASNQLGQEKKEKLDTFNVLTTQLMNEFDAKHQQMRIELDFKRRRLRRNAETKRKQLRNKLISELEPELIKAEYQNVLGKYSDFRATLKTIDVKIGSEKEIVKSLLRQGKDIPKTQITRKKTLLWDTTTEIPNVGYEKIQEKIQEHQLALNGLQAEKEGITAHLARLDKQFATLRGKLNDNEEQLSTFDLETENKLAAFDDETTMKLKTFDAATALLRKKLADERAQKNLKMMNHFKEAEERLNGKQAVALSIAENQKSYMENVYVLLGQKYEQAKLAKAEEEVTLKLATKPFKPICGEPRGTAKKTIIVGLLLFMLCVGFVYLRELFIRVRSEMEQ